MKASGKLTTRLEDIIKQRESSALNFIDEEAKQVHELLIDSLDPNPYQPRRSFSHKDLHELSQSIARHGVFTPILVRANGNRYQIVAGERRTRASKLANKTAIPAIIVKIDDERMQEIALLENLQRADLNAIEQARSFQSIMKVNRWTQQQLSKELGLSRPQVANIVRLLNLPNSVITMVEKGQLKMGHVRPLLVLPTSVMEETARRIIKEKLTVRDVESLFATKPTQYIEVRRHSIIIHVDSEEEKAKYLKLLRESSQAK